MAGELQLAKGLKTTTNVPADSWRGPYTTVANACTAIPTVMRLYRTVDIITENGLVEYWWKNGATDNDLVEKSVANNLGNWGVDINGWLTSSESASGIVTPAWTIDEYGNFTGTSTFANNAGHADYADSLGYMWFDNGSELYSVDGRGISTPNWNIDSEGNINGVFWNINNGFFSGTANMAASLYGEWFPDENYNLSTGTNIRGINTGMWNITPDGLFSGNAANATQAVNASVLNYTWFDNGETLNAFSEGVGHLPRGINTLNWNINASGNAFLNELHLRDLANAPTDFGYVFFADGGLNCFDINDWKIFGIQGDNISMGDGGNGGAWSIYKPYGLATGSSVGCWMPNVNAKTLAVSVNNNFADTTGNINLPIPTYIQYSPTINSVVNIDITTVPLTGYFNYLENDQFVTVVGKIKFKHSYNSTVTSLNVSMPTGFITNTLVAFFNGGVDNNAITGVCKEVIGNQFIEIKFTSLAFSTGTTPVEYNFMCTYRKQPAI